MALGKFKLAMSICEYLLNELAESSDQLGQTVSSSLKPCFLATDRGEWYRTVAQRLVACALTEKAA